MIEILDDLDVLTQPDVDLHALSLAGVRYGSKAADAIARHQIKEITFSPIVRRTGGGSGIDAEYYGVDGERLSFAEVIDSVINTDGMVHYADNTSYKITGGMVVGFALYGAERSHLAHFGFLRSYDEFLGVFGTPDLVEESIDVGELMGYRHYYWACKKQVYWDSWDERLNSVNLGDYDGNNRRHLQTDRQAGQTTTP